MIKAVIFDLDGTLIDSTEAIVESFFHAFDMLGEPRPPREAIITSIGFELEQQFARMTQLPTAECARLFRERYVQVCLPKTILLPHARECLALLRAAGLALGFATSKPRRFSDSILENLSVLEFFTSRVGPDDVKLPKPDPEAVVKSLENLGATADEVLFVGDTDFDVLAARSAGVACLGLTTGALTREQLEQLKPAAVYDSLLEVADYALARKSQA